MDALLDKTGRLNSNVQVSKFTALVLSTGSFKDGVDVPSGANVGPIAGIAQESIVPDGFNDYSLGVYQVTSGTAWPANAIPASATGRGISYRASGISRCLAASAISVGDEVNIADNTGRIKTVSEGGGTLIYVIGQALDAASQAGDVVRVLVNLIRRKV